MPTRSRPPVRRTAARPIRLRHVASAALLALVVGTLTAGPADARAERAPLPRDGDHNTSSIDTTVPAGGSSMLTTPTIGKDIKTLTVTVKPKNTDVISTDTYDDFIHTLGTLSKQKKLLVCVMMYQAIVAPQNSFTDEYQVDAFFATVAGAVLVACLQLAGFPSAKQAGRSGARSPCNQSRPSLPATVTKVDGGYSVKASGTATKAKKSKLKIKCSVTGHTVRYTIRAAKKGQSLRKAAGKKISLGIRSPADAATSVPVNATFVMS